MSYAFSLASTALFVIAVQNPVLIGGLGSSEAFRMAAKPKWLLAFSAFISMFSVSLSIICVLLDLIPEIKALNQHFHYLIYIGVLAALYLASCLIAMLLKADKGLISRLSVAALYSLVLSIPMINHLSGFNIYKAAGYGLGAGAAFCLAVLLINAGVKRLRENDEIPPAVFIYAALISLGLYALSGRVLMI
jgi:Na+-translocating ferredoxin:NAD+ oxidoreductase RnfA subunit